MSAGDILIALATGLAANECCDLAPWCARKLVRWSAFHRYTDPARADARAEELAALINDRPGHMLKLTTALCFAGCAALASAHRFLTRQRRPAQQIKRTAAPPALPLRDTIENTEAEISDRLNRYLWASDMYRCVWPP